MQTPQELELDQDREELQSYLLDHPDDFVTHILQFNEMLARYRAASQEITTKLEILRNDFNTRQYRNPIESIQTRIKRPASIVGKMKARGMDITLESIEKELNDIAGIRVVCSFIDDIYMVAEKLLAQDDLRLIRVKDYIKNPKPNGYRSYHLVLQVPVFLSDRKEMVRVEVQLRTIAMDFWASLEHQIHYKTSCEVPDSVVDELKQCADIIAQTDERMQQLSKQIRCFNAQPTSEGGEEAQEHPLGSLISASVVGMAGGMAGSHND